MKQELSLARVGESPAFMAGEDVNPVFVSCERENGQREAWCLASLVFNVLLVALTALVLLGEWLAPLFVNRFLVPGYSSSEQALVTTLTRIMLVQPLILGLGTVFTAILSSKRRFLLPALSIAIYNFGLIGGLLCSLAIPGVGIYGPTYGVLVAAVCQVLVQVPGLRKEGLQKSERESPCDSSRG
jgi:putative peptidoglycan lipid II flippase